MVATSSLQARLPVEATRARARRGSTGSSDMLNPRGRVSLQAREEALKCAVCRNACQAKC